MPSEYVGSDPTAGQLGSSPLFAKIWDNVRAAQRVRQLKERDWWVQREFFRGNQNAVWIVGRGLVVNPPPDEKLRKKPRLMVNECRVIVETLLAYLLKQEPVFETTANTGEPEDQAAAALGRTILYHYWNKEDCARKLEDVGLWALVTGIAWWKIGWDPLKGEERPIIESRQAAPSPEELQQFALSGRSFEPRMEQVVTGYTPEGDLSIQPISPFELVIDPGAMRLDEAQWVAYQAMLPVDKVRADYPEQADKIVPDETQIGGTDGSYARQALQSHGAAGAMSAGRDKIRRVRVTEFWHRKGREYPEGLRAVTTNKLLLSATGTPQGYDEIPFAQWVDRPVPGEFYPDATLRDLIPLQKELNRRVSQAVDIANKFKTKYLAVAGSIDEEQLSDEDGEVLEHAPGQRPEAVRPPELPDSLVRLIEISKEGMREVSGSVAVLQGQVSGEVRSGRQVAYQGQYGETRISLMAKRLARFLASAGTMILKQVSANVTEQRIARVVGKNRRVEIKFFKGADLRGNTDVTVQPGSLLGFTRVERFQMLKDMHDRRVIDEEKFLEAMEFEDYTPLIEDVAQDRNNALEENEAWREGRMSAAALYFEDHRVHLHTHNQFRKSATYRVLSPLMRQIVDGHCQEHERYLVPSPAEPPTPAAASGPGAQSPMPFPGGPPSQLEQSLSERQSGAERAAGLPPVPPVADIGPENQH